jgi:membrane protein implicated in regulation of membrane protease activity
VIELLLPISHWHWWVLALALLILEALVSGFFLLWLSVAAGVAGLVLFLFPATSWQIQLLIFAVLAVASIAAFRLLARRRPAQSDQPTLNRRGQQYVGRTFTLDAPIVDGVGEMRVDDTVWRVVGDDSGAGERVQVVAVEGNALRVLLLAE